MTDVFFSVIITTFNRKEYLQKCINSVLNQSFNKFEIIVIDDCSNYDFNSEIIKNNNDEKLIFLQNDFNQGPAYSRNKGINISKGNYIALLDDDDEWKNNHLLDLSKLITNKPFGKIFFSGVEIFSEFENKIIKTKIPNYRYKAGDLFKENFITTSSVIINKMELGKLRFEESLKYPEDYLLWMQLSGFDTIYANQNTTVKYQILKNSNNLTSQKTDFITNQRFKMLTFLDEYYFDNHIYNNCYKEKAHIGVYLKIIKDYLNQKNKKLSIFYLKELIKKHRIILFKNSFYYVLLRLIKIIFI